VTCYALVAALRQNEC